MKKTILLFCFFVLSFRLLATNYYLSNTGNDNNAGTSSSAPWQSIIKLNTTIYAPGDTVFLKCGDIFRGTITINVSGNSSSRIVFTSYGTGNKAIISGSQVVTGWIASGNYYTTPYTGTVTNFFVDGKEQTLARYPNEHSYLTLDSAQTGSLVDASLASLNSNLITGSRVCVHTSQWSWEKATVASYSGNQIVFGSSMYKALNNYGYFLYDNINHLDTANEWKYDATNNILYYYPPSGNDPNTKTCEVSFYQNGIDLSTSVSYVTIANLAFANQSNAGVQIGYNTNKYIDINNCSFSGQYNHGVNVKGKYCHISNSYFRDVDGMSIYINGTGAGSVTVDHNVFRNNGVTRANGLGGQLNGTAIMCACDSSYFHHNNIDSAGYCGISADGGYNIVERNIIDHAMLIENDGGGVKGWGVITTHSIYRNNFISNSDGNTEGTYQGNFVTPAIYFDFYVNNSTISDNTVYNHAKKGIFQNSSNHDNTITGNVIYGGSFMLDLIGSGLAAPTPVPITGMIIKHNSFFSKDNNSVIIRQVDYTGAFNAGTLDSNYYFQPYNANRYALRMNGTTPTYYTFPSWQATGNDSHTQSSFVHWTYPTSHDTLLMNPTDNVVSINLGTTKYLDLDSNDVCTSITLQPYTSQILINTHTNCTVGITENNTSPILVFPNPNNGDFIIKLDNVSNKTTIEIYNSLGQNILTKQAQTTENTISLQDQANGIYLIKILVDTKVLSYSKIIKE